MFGRLAIKKEVLDYFAAWITDASYCWHAIPVTMGVLEPYMVRQHYLFYSLPDLLAFCHLHTTLLQRPGSNVFSVIGACPNADQVAKLNREFPNAKMIGVFDDDLLGKILDCKIALWLKGDDTRFYLTRSEVHFEYNEKKITIAEPLFSLHRFRTIIGIRFSYQTIKPQSTTSFVKILRQRDN